MAEEWLIDTIKLFGSEGVFDGIHDDLVYWHVGFWLAGMSGNTILRAEGE